MKLTKIIFIVSILNFSLFLVLIFNQPPTSVPGQPLTKVPEINITPSSMITPSSPQNSTSNALVTPKVIPPTPTVAPVGCLITISGVRYDLTRFRLIHSGGDIFQCGSDMTTVFNNQHSSDYLSKISQYQIN